MVQQHGMHRCTGRVRGWASCVVCLANPLTCYAQPCGTTGVMTVGYSTDAADQVVQADIVAAGYGKMKKTKHYPELN